MELTQLTFAVDTTPLDTADKKIRGLGEALKTLERPMSAIAKDSSTVASGVEEVASKAQAAGSKLKGVEANLEKVSTAMKIFRGETVEVGDEVVNLGSSFTKSQANFLALQKQLGASADQLKSFAKEFNDFNRITSANTFDNSIAGVQRLTKDIRELSEVNKLAAANTTLTRDQVMNLVRDTERLQQAMQSMGKSNDEINASIAQQTQQYVNLANEKNKLIAQTKAMEDSARAAASAELERAKASAYVTKEAEKLAFVNAQLKEGFTVSSANALYKYKEALDLTGVSADQAKTKLAAFGEQLKSKQSSSPFAALVKDAEETRKQVNHLARDVSVQLGDIAISLAGGQNPFMVMIQQGDQIRGALMRAKDSGVDSSNAIRNALDMMVTSFVDVGKMAGTFFVGSIESAGNAVKRLVVEKTFLGTALDTVNTKMQAQGGTVASLASGIQRLGSISTTVAGVGVLGLATALAGVVVVALQNISRQQELNKALNFSAAGFGLSAEGAMQLASSLDSAGVSLKTGTEALTSMASGGKLSVDTFQAVAVAAQEMKNTTGQAVATTVSEFEKLAKDPSKSLAELAGQTGFVTAETLNYIDVLQEEGRTQEAVEIAVKAAAVAKIAAARAMYAEAEPLVQLWIDIKTAVSSAWDEFSRVVTGSNALSGAFRTGWELVAVTVSEVWYVLKMTGNEIGGIAAQIAAVASGNLSGAVAIGKEMQKDAEVARKAQDDLVASLLNRKQATTQLGDAERKRNADNAAIFDTEKKFRKEIDSVLSANDKKTLSRQDLINKKVTEYKNSVGEANVNQKTLNDLIKATGIEWDKAQKKTPKGLKPKETFSVNLTNEVEESKKAYDRQLKIAKDYESSRRDILKNSYEARMISLGDYVGQEIKLSIQARDKQLEIARQGNEEYNTLMQKNRKAIEDAAQSAIDKGGLVSAIREKEKKDLEDLDRKVKGVNDAYLSQAEALDAATDKRFSDFYKELAKSAIESEKSLVDFTATVQNNANARKEEIDLQLKLIGAHGAEAEAIKASSAAMKSYAPEIAKQTKLLADQEKVLRDLNEQMKDATPEEAERLDVLGMQALENTAKIRKNLDRTVSQARQDSEQAATDASTKYQIEKYNELKGTLSDSIYTAIFEGGKKGGDVLKNYLMKEFKNFTIKVFIEPIVGSIIGSLAGASGASGSGGGGGAIGTIGNVISTGSTVMKMLTNPMVLGNQMAQGVVAVGDALFKAGFEQMGNAVTGWASTANASALLGSIGSVVGGYGVSKLIGNGYQTGLGNAVDIAGTIGSYFFGPVAGVVSGIVNRAFGRKLKDTGIEGTFSNTGFEGQNYQFYKGGWLRSDKTTYSEMDQTMENLLSYQFKRLQLETAVLATSIGAGVDSIKDFTKKIKVSFKGLDEKQINEKLTEVYTEISNEMAAGVLRSLVKSSEPAKFEGLNIQENILGIEFTKLSQLEASVAVWNKSIETGFDAAGNKLSEGWIRKLGDAVNQANDILDSQTEKLIESYQWFGETFSETLKRLSSSITTVNESFRDLGYTLMDVSLQGASKASDIISLFGGEDQYVQATGYFYENAYTQEEKAANLTNRLSEALGRVNEKLPDSISGYRDLVDAYAKQGDAGREVWASLVQLFPAFEQLVDLNEEIANSFNNLLGNYYEKFGTEAERVAFQTGLLQKSLAEVGIELPKTREEYVLQVKAYQNLGDAGKEVLTVLLENADAFDTLYPAVKTVTDYYNELKNAVKSNEDIARERIILEERLFNATATTAEIAEKARNAIDPMNQSLYDTVLAAERLKAATENLPDALESSLGRAPVQEELNHWIDQVASGAITLQDAMKGIARDGSTEKLALRLLELNDAEGYLAETRKRVLSTMTPLQQEYQKQIWNLEDEAKSLAFAKQISKTKTDADIRLLKAQGNIAEAERLQREQFINGLSDLTEVQKQAEIGAYDYAKAIDKQIATLQEHTGLENRLYQLLGNTAILRERELAALDPSNRALQQRIWAIEDAESALGKAKSATDEAMSKVREIADSQITELEKQATATDRVYESLSNAVEKQKESLNKELERATEQSQNLKDIFDTLTQSIKDLRSEAESTKQIGIDEARSLIRTATVTGVLPEKDKLSEAVGVLNAGVAEGVYSTKVEQQKAILLLSNDLEALKNVTEPQLTTAEATVKSLENQIKQLDDLLQSSKEQIDIARGTNAEVMTVADAQSKLQSAIAAEKQSLSQIAEIKRQVRLAEQQYNALNNINTGVKTLVDAIASLSKAMADQKLAQGLLDQAKSPSIDGQPAPANSVITSPTLTNEVLTEAQIKAGYRKMYEGIDVDKARLEQNLVDKAYKAVNQADSIGGAAARAAWESGANNADAMKARDDAIAGFLTSQGYASDLFSKQHKAIFNSTNDPMAGVKAIAESIGVSDNWLKFSQASFPTTPAFADGGYYPGGLALVGEEGPELINFNNPGMVYTAAQSANLMKGDNSDLAEELRALRQEVQMLRAEARATAINTSKTARILDDVSQGGDSLKTTTA